MHAYTAKKNAFGELKLVCEDCGHEAEYGDAIVFFMMGILTGMIDLEAALMIALVLNFDESAAAIPDELLENDR